jgi:hypothetical protein
LGLTVTASGGGAAVPGIQLKVRVLTNAAIPASANIGTQSGAAAHTVSITPAATGSVIHAATVNGAAVVTPASGMVTSAKFADALNTFGYGAFLSGSTTAGTPVTMGATDTANGAVAAVEVQASGGTLTVDGSSPATAAVSQDSTTVTTFPFTPPLGSVLIAMVSCGGTGTTQPVTVNVWDSYGLTWIPVAESATEGNDYAGVWYAVAPAPVAVSTAALQPGTVGYSYQHQLVATDGYGAAYQWSVSSGSLPAGLALSRFGVLSGVPTASGTSTFTVSAADPFGNTGTSVSLSVAVSAIPSTAPTVVGAWHGNPGASNYFYGTYEQPVFTTDHDWLFVSVSWADSTENANGSIAFVSDNAHNAYQEVTYNTGGIHTQIWACPNAAAATKLFISTSAYAKGLQVCVVDVRGLGAGYVIDASISTNAGSVSSFTQSRTLTTSDFVFVAGAFAAGNTSITQAGSGATFNSVYAGTNNLVSQAVSWANATAGTVSMQYSAGSAHAASGGMIAVKAAQPAPVNSNPAWPVIQVQAAFGYNQQTPVGLHNWTDLTSRFQALSGNRGRSFELDEMAAADITLTLDNFDGALSPGNANSPYYPNVTLMTPVRVLAIWQGRWYTLFSGIMLAIPQTYDFQRGLVKVALSDDYCRLPQILLGSAMVEELLYDIPLNLWPMNEQSGSPIASNWSGRSTAMLVPTAGKLGGGLSSPPSGVTNGFPYPSNSGFGAQNGNGAGLYPVWPSGLQGTQDSVFGNIGGTPGGHYYAGTALVDAGDKKLPWTTTGATYEVWACIANVTASRTSGAVVMTLADDAGSNGGGIHFRLRLVGGSSPGIQVEQLSLSGKTFHTVRTRNLYDSKWHHYAVTISTGNTITVYLDGVSAGSFTGYTIRSKPTLLQFAGDVTVDPRVGAPFQPGFYTGFTAYGAVFDQVLDSSRIFTHYQSGRTGFDTESTGARIQRVLTYARWFAPQAIESGVARMQMFNYLNTGGYGSAGLTGSIGQFNTAGGAALADGSQSDMVVSDIAMSENGFLFVAADGTLTFRSRGTQYSLPSRGTLGDMDYALNRTSNFLNGTLGEWGSPSGCTLTFSNGWGFTETGCALMTVTGSPSQATIRGLLIPVQATQGVSMWVMSPQGCYAHAAIDWYNSSGGHISTTAGLDTWCPPNTPVKLKVNATGPVGGAASFTFTPVMFGTTSGSAPVNGSQLYVDRPRASVSGFAVPYEPDVEITMDVQYLYNDLVITRNIDQAAFRFLDATSRQVYYPRAYTRVIYTSPADSQAVPDAAGWLLHDYSVPRERVEQLAIIPSANPEAWEFCLGIDIGDIVSFTRTPAGTFVPTGSFMVLSVEIEWGPDEAKFTYTLAPNPYSALVLDDPVKGVLVKEPLPGRLPGPINRLGW